MAEVELEVIRRLERAMLNSWPALSVVLDGGWVIRLADGYTKRANSVTCLDPDDMDVDARIERAERIFGQHVLPTIFRLSPLASPALEAALAERGWRQFDETIVMTCELAMLNNQQDTAAPNDDGDHDVDIRAEPDEAWLLNCDRIEGPETPHLQTLRQMLNRLLLPAGFARIDGQDGIDAMALMVVDGELTGLFDLLTAPHRRRQGLGSALLRHLFAWSAAEGAKTVWLSVLAHNQPARHLYQSLGFREVYRYYHRSNDQIG